MRFQAYFEEWSRQPGQPVRLAVSTDSRRYRASFERVVGGPGAPDECRVPVEPVPNVLDGQFVGRLQRTPVGAYAVLPLNEEIDASGCTIHFDAWPTATLADRRQVLLALGDGERWTTVELSPAGLALCVDRGELTRPIRLADRTWHSVVVALGRDGTVGLNVRRLGRTTTIETETTGRSSDLPVIRELRLAADRVESDGSPTSPFDGKLGSPSLHVAAFDPSPLAELHGRARREFRPAAWWDLTQGIAHERLVAAGRLATDGTTFNGVERGVTGPTWTGQRDSYVASPEEYAALQFHSDAVGDAGWEYDVEFVLPESLPSGVYAVKLEADGETDRYPLFVGAREGDETEVLLLFPTNTYLAYANDRLAEVDLRSVMSHRPALHPDDRFLLEHKELGRSLYDTHGDKTPVRSVSRRRPLITVRPGYPSWFTNSYRHFAADLYILEWLRRTGLPFDVATDDDLDANPSLLERYDVVVTGSHPEYWTRRSLEALELYLAGSGRLMYLGANGFYWVTTRHPDRPWTIEVRRDNAGTRAWDAPPGERLHAGEPEIGGLWKHRGRPPHSLVGIGTAAEGWSQGVGYQRAAASHKGPYAFLFDGIEADVVGEHGYILGGSVSDELDRYDVISGSPSEAVVLASSMPLGREYQLAIEEQLVPMPDQDGVNRPDLVRADMVVFSCGEAGKVFSAGSIGYAGGLAVHDFENDLVRLTTRALAHFLTSD